MYPGCTGNEFKCRNPGNGRRCIYDGRLCDGNADCADASDEDSENCFNNGQSPLVCCRMQYVMLCDGVLAVVVVIVVVVVVVVVRLECDPFVFHYGYISA